MVGLAMQPIDLIKQYSNTVGDQIRWKKARNMVAQEIENHIYDQRDTYILNGENENEAVSKAILQMGDPVSIGLELDKAHRPKPQGLMLFLTGALMLIGMLANYYINVSMYSLNHFSFVPYLAAFLVFGVCYYLDFTLLGKYPVHLYSLVILISAVAVLLGSEVNGQKYWLDGFSFNLAYLSLLFPLVYALLIYKMRGKGFGGLFICGLGYLLPAAILFLIPTYAGLVVFTLSALVILCFSIIKGWFGDDRRNYLLFVLIPTSIVAVFIFLFLVQATSFLSRIKTLINPYPVRSEDGYVYCLIRDLLGNSRFIGQGTIPTSLGYGNQEVVAYSPGYILTFLTHNVGWISFVTILAVIATFSVIGLYKISKQKSVLGTLVALAIMLSFIFQSISYVINNLGYGLLPSVSLPFISYGKTALLLNAALIGFMLSVFRTGDVYLDHVKSPLNHFRRRFSRED